MVTAPTNFDALGVSPDLVGRLRADGIEAPFPIQVAAIPVALEGRDLYGQAQTGSGKTLAFALPTIQRRPPSTGKPYALIQPLSEQDLEELEWKGLAKRRLARAWEGEGDGLYDYL